MGLNHSNNSTRGLQYTGPAIVDLTREYILWQFGTIKRSAIIDQLDKHIQNISTPTEEMIDLSLSTSLDDYSFARLMIPFVNPTMLTRETVLPFVIDAVRNTPPEGAVRLLAGLDEYVHQEWPKGINHPIGRLYYQLQHLLHDISEGFATPSDISKLFTDWLRTYAPNAS